MAHRTIAAAVGPLLVTLGVATSSAADAAPARVVEITPDTAGLEVNRYYSLHAHGPTKKFYAFPDLRVVVVVHANPASADRIETTAVAHCFDAAVDPEGIDKWINNQHSDALHPDVPEPRRSIEIDRARLHATVEGPLEHEVAGGGDEYDRYRVDFTIDGFTDGDLTIKPSRGSAAAFVRTKDPTPQ